jgi:hypothetical protein
MQVYVSALVATDQSVSKMTGLRLKCGNGTMAIEPRNKTESRSKFKISVIESILEVLQKKLFLVGKPGTEFL